MRVLVLYAHPVAESYGSALHGKAVAALKTAGHNVDDCDLYQEQFEPCMNRAERVNYHSLDINRTPVADYVERLRKADALILIYPVWNYGYPAILKGFFDRVFLPGVSFVMQDGMVQGNLDNIKKITVITTYGGPRWAAFTVGDPPRKLATRILRRIAKLKNPVQYLAHYDMNRSTDKSRRAFMDKVVRAMRSF